VDGLFAARSAKQENVPGFAGPQTDWYEGLALDELALEAVSAAELVVGPAVAACDGTPITASAMADRTATAPARPAATRFICEVRNM
jgi:hypothetical protein